MPVGEFADAGMECGSVAAEEEYLGHEKDRAYDHLEQIVSQGGPALFKHGMPHQLKDPATDEEP